MDTALSLAEHHDIAQLIYREARLLDDLELEQWLTLFSAEGLYWIPIDEDVPVSQQAALIYDDSLRREERVYHLVNLSFPAQSPRSRTVHVIGNIEAQPTENGQISVRCTQAIYEVRTGDFSQIGLGQVRPLVATVHYLIDRAGSEFKIALKKILLIDREMPQSNLTFIL